MDEYINFEQVPFGVEQFAENPEPRCPCVLLLDTSISMGGAPIAALNAGVQLFREELLRDKLAVKRVEVSIVTFGPVHVVTPFRTVPQFAFHPLDTTGDTPMGAAIETAIKLLAERKQEYKNNGIAYYKPWIILITDGAPTDEYVKAAQMVKVGEETNAFAFFAIGVENAQMDILAQIATRKPLKLKGLMFREFFMWLSASMKIVSSKQPGTAINLLPPSGWSEL